jgi:hypothetical protein
MKKILGLLFGVFLVFGAGPCVARGDVINGSTTGLASPGSTITFGEIVLPVNTELTTQYAGLGVSFSPAVFYNPQSWPQWANNVGNFTFPTQPAYVDPVTLMFSSTQTGAAFQLATEDSPFLFQAFLGSSLVDSFSVPLVGDVGNLYYGFANESFDSVVISYEGGGGGPYWLMGNLELSNNNAVVPEPPSLLLLGAGLAGLVGLLSRKFCL